MNNKYIRVHTNQDKNNAFFGTGDIISVKCIDGTFFIGEITCIDLKKEGNKLHTVMDIRAFDNPRFEKSFWIENIVELDILKFKAESSDDIPRLSSKILSGEISIYDIPFELRTSDTSYYIYAFRFARSINRLLYDNTLSFLESDIKKISQNTEQHIELKRLYERMKDFSTINN